MARILILGAYGLIGSACLKHLQAAGHDVTGLGRSATAARATDPEMEWIIRDLTSIDSQDWQAILTNVDVIVNAAGALQDGARDRVAAIHADMLDQLTQTILAMNHPIRLIQISAAGVHANASTAFFRTKAQGDAFVMERLTDWVILRPTLVLASEAYGGTALLRGAAALPFVLPRVYPASKIQTVHVDDVAAAVCACAKGAIASGTCVDLTEHGTQSLPDLTRRMRTWLGVAPARVEIKIPDWFLALTGRCADLLGHLGWRPAMRSTALRALQDGVNGDPQVWERAGGSPCRSLSQSLRDMPATTQERLFARSYFALPLAIGVLSLFWLLSGLITLAQPGTAMSELTGRGVSDAFAVVTVWGGTLADIALGMAILWRPWARGAALGMVVLSLAYLCGSAILAPDLWSDPLGPMVKVLPGMALAAMVALMLEDR